MPAGDPAAPAADALAPPAAPAWSRAARAVTSPLAVSMALFSASLAAALREAMRMTEGRLVYALDDAYIHMAIAKNLARHGVWGCTPLHFSSSSSSLLWTSALGAAYRAFGVRDATPLVLNVAFAVATLVVADRFLGRLLVPRLVRTAALAGLVVAFPLAGAVLMGLEHVLHLLLTIAFAGAAVEALADPPADARVERRRTALLCVLGALLATSRYEGLFLVGLVCLAFLLRRRPVRAIAIGAAALLPVAAFGALSVALGSFVLPNPLMLKAVGDSASLFTKLLRPFGSEDLAFLQNNRAMPVLLLAAAVAALARWRAHRDGWRPVVLLPLLLGGMILLHGHYVFSPLYWVYRYDAYLVGFGILVAAAVAADLRGPAALPRGAPSALLLASLVVVVADLREGLRPRTEIEGSRSTYLEHVQTARFVARYYAREAVVVNDLGAVTFYTEGRVLDLVGLGDDEPLRFMRRGSYGGDEVRSWTAPHRPAIAIVQLGWSLVGPLIPPDWIQVAEVEVPPHRHRLGFLAVDPGHAWVLRAQVAQHFGPLVPRLGHRVVLRPPEQLRGLLADARAR
jgi:hypothetical protein